jgi:hypothetical protein
MIQQPAGFPGIFRRDYPDFFQNTQCPQGNILQVADWGCHYIKCIHISIVIITHRGMAV